MRPIGSYNSAKKTAGRSRRRDISALNMYRKSTYSSEEAFQSDDKCQPVTLQSARDEVKNILSKIFQDRKGTLETTPSCCSHPKPRPERPVSKLDKRLQYWKDHLEERKKIAAYIEKTKGKKREQVLFNRRSTIDEPDKQAVLRTLDYADRMNPIALLTKKTGKLKAYFDADNCREIPELQATLPLAERTKVKAVEITGMPCVARKEQLGRERTEDLEFPSHWFQSAVLEQRIDEKREDIARVLEFYPEIDNLQVVGVGYDKIALGKHDSDIQLLPETVIKSISDETAVECSLPAELNPPTETTVPDYAVQINDRTFLATARRSALNVEVDVMLECEPFETVAKCIIHIENTGKKVLNFCWYERSFYEHNAGMLHGTDGELVFDHSHFRLTAGETREIVVQFHPRRAIHIKERWLLKVDPQFFCRKNDPIVVKLTGKCVPSPEYIAKLDEIDRDVTEKSNFRMATKITSNIASLVPLMTPPERLCAYQRLISEYEVFELENPGLKCERLQDLELLKEIYKSLKKPREPAWDLNIGTLKELILSNESADERSMMFAQLMFIVNNMRGQPIDFDVKLDLEEGLERERTRWLLVRSVLCTGVDEWESMAVKVEETFVKSVAEEYSEWAQEQQKQNMEEDDAALEESTENFDEVSVPGLRRQKALRDTLYMQTYQHLCNVAEAIVNVIESTDGI